ncbi:MAG: glycine--tRNA ligase subunit beta [bacterium]|nr:glycine--tRNA ligase subunit beta [bacterium]
MSQDTKLLIMEIGTEEIPAEPLSNATKQLAELAAKALDEKRLEHGKVSTYSTPRRIILEVEDVASESTPLEQVFRGPSADRAFDADGAPTKAALGFARGKGVAVEDLVREKEGDVEYIYAKVSVPSQSATEILGEVLPGLIGGIYWKKSQRWGTCQAHFSRPIRWLVALYGSDVVEFEFANLKSGRVSYGHRFLAPEPIELAEASELLPALTNAYVAYDQNARAADIRAQIARIEEETGLVAEVPPTIFLEVNNLVEFPTVLVGHFDEEFLNVPSEIITDAMLSHQRYFPLYSKAGDLSCKFLLVSNGSPKRSETIVEGNERVVRARLADAAFFYHEDLKHPLEHYVDGLAEQVFQEKLGTMRDKVSRIVALAGTLARRSGADEATVERTERAALLAKADLVTNAVVEFTSQQGIMGGYYARASHEPEEVAIAIEQHYRPKFAGDAIPDNDEGRFVALADKLDTIAGLFAIGQPPTGSKDPFALRRSAIGIIAILQSGIDVNLGEAIEAALDGYAGIEFDRVAVSAQIREFFAGRLATIAKDQGFDTEAINAVLAIDIIEPTVVIARCETLTQARHQDEELFADLAIAYKRANNLRDKALGTEFDESLAGSEEKALIAAISSAKASIEAALASGDYPAAISALAGLRAPIDAFFDGVMVMDKDEAIKANRLRLLNSFVSAFDGVADFEKLAK